MILVRNVFRLKFGKAREAVAAMKEAIAETKRLGYGDGSTRLLTDLTGPYYTLVMESVFSNLASLEQTTPKVMGDKQWQASYQKLVPLVESGYREIFTIVE
jgi:hypothetical protein